VIKIRNAEIKITLRLKSDAQIPAEQDEKIRDIFRKQMKDKINGMMEVAFMKPVYTSDEFIKKHGHQGVYFPLDGC
jgi:hypothetical protein